MKKHTFLAALSVVCATPFVTPAAPAAFVLTLNQVGSDVVVEHWLRALPTVRVYAGERGRVRPAEVPVLDGRRVSDGAGIDLDLEELRRGTWVGERTLRLTNGWQVVFVSPYS